VNDFMPSQEERLLIVEQTLVTLRMDLLQVISDNTRSMTALNRVVVQQEQNLSDANHEITILVGVIGRQGQDIKTIKEDLGTVQSDLGTVRSDLSTVQSDLGTVRSDLSTVQSDLGTIKTSVEAHDRRFDSVDQRLDSLDKKFDQVLLMLSNLTSGPQQET
jgi:chromosome segregation ATPase